MKLIDAEELLDIFGEDKPGEFSLIPLSEIRKTIEECPTKSQTAQDRSCKREEKDQNHCSEWGLVTGPRAYSDTSCDYYGRRGARMIGETTKWG